MSALTSRSPSRPRSTRSLILTDEREDMDGHDGDWKLGPNVQVNVVLKKLDLQNLKHFQTFPQILKVKSKSKSNIQKHPVRKLMRNDKNFVEALRDLLPRCDPNCHHCEQYILKLSQHIQSAHDPQEDEQRILDSVISKDQETEAGTNVDLDIEPSLRQSLTQDSESQSRTLIIRHTKVIHYVEELDENILGQLSMTTEGQVASTSTTFQNCLSESSEFKITDVEDVEVQYNSDQVQNFEKSSEPERYENQKSGSVIANFTSTSSTRGLQVDNGNESDPDYVDKNDMDSESEGNEAIKNKKSEISEDEEIENENFEKSDQDGSDPNFAPKVDNDNDSDPDYVDANDTDSEMEEEKSEENLKVDLKIDTVKTVKDIHTGKNIKIRIHTENNGQEIVKTIQMRKNLIRKIYTGEKRYGCEKCGKTYPNSGLLTIHQRIHTNIWTHTNKTQRLKCKKCDKTFQSKNSLSTHEKTHNLGHIPYDCEFCGKRFKNKYTAHHHLNAHKGKIHICEICGKKLKRKMYLEKHRKLFHTGEIKSASTKMKIHNCETCGKNFISTGLLTIHIRSHTGEKPFMCEICSACFNSSTNLKGHMPIHQEKSHICDHCGLTFPKRSYLQSHVKIHTRENPYKCENCDESFLYEKQLQFHKKVHTGGKVYKCDCGKYFREMKQLTMHKKNHKEERKFKCSVCSKSFKLKSHLKTHFKIHIGIKAHKCEKCEKTFLLPSELKSHRKKNPNCKPEARACDAESLLSIIE